MNSEKCQICENDAVLNFSETVMKKYSANYYYCRSCDYIFTPAPTWLEEAYASPISREDTDQASRNVFNAIRTAAIFYGIMNANRDSVFVDVAAGYGLFTRLMRDIGFNYFWSDIYTENLFSKGFEYKQYHETCLAISAFEVLEHVQNPKLFLSECLEEYKTDTIIFTTETFPDHRPPKAGQWAYFSFETGQHISFFSDAGLEQLAKRLNLNFYKIGRIYIFTKRHLASWRIKSVRNKFVTLFLFSIVARKFGHRRASDQRLLQQN